MKQILQLVEKGINGKLRENDREILKENTDKWKESIEILREDILNGNMWKKGCDDYVDDAVEEESISADKKVSKAKYYDGSDISKECADKVGVKKYIELDDYLVFCREKFPDTWDSPGELVCCSKATGEEIILDLAEHSEISEMLSSDIFFVEMNDEFNGYEKYIYFVKDESNICRYDVETHLSEIVQFENKISKMRISEYYVVVMYEGENTKVACCNLETKEKKVLNFNEEIRDLYLVGDKVYFFSGYTFYRKDIETEILSKIDEHVEYDKSRFLSDIKNINYYDGILYSKTIDNDLVFVDVNNPLAIQKLEMWYKNKKVIWGYRKIYYIDLDASGAIGFYDIVTKESGIIKEKTSDIVKKFEEGVLIKKTSYLPPTHIQIVGKWLYYKSNDYREQEDKCIEVIL